MPRDEIDVDRIAAPAERLGLVGPDPRSVGAFRIEATITAVMLTAEPSGGTPKPTPPVLAQGNVPAATSD